MEVHDVTKDNGQTSNHTEGMIKVSDKTYQFPPFHFSLGKYVRTLTTKLILFGLVETKEYYSVL